MYSLCIKYLTIFCLAILVTSTINIDDGNKFTSQTLQDDPFIQVIVNAKHKPLDSFQKEYYVVRTIEKEKRVAYMKMVRIFDKIVKILKKHQIIPDQDSLVKSKIKPQYFSKKRRWTFSTMFVIYGTSQELEKSFIDLIKIGVQRLSTKPSINFLNQKLEALQLFNYAKQKVIKLLQPFDGYEILEVDDIEIKGTSVQNSDILQEQIEEQFNHSEEVVQEEDLDVEGEAEAESQVRNSELQMKVIFRVGESSETDSNEQDDDSSESEQDEKDQEQESSSSSGEDQL